MRSTLLSFDAADRFVHAHDASVYRMVPRAVARPQSVSEVVELLQWAREQRTGVTFRTGGTSLSGQAVTEGLLVLLGRPWDHLNVENEGAVVRCGPAVRGGVVNSVLARYQRRIGPDPASLQAACMGGIVANNASGMCCGVEENSYETLAGMKLILASGQLFDTGDEGCNDKLKALAPELTQGLLSLREKVLASPRLVNLIRRKTAGKNTMGYSLKAFLDYSDAAGLLSHLMVGSEGTLAFLAEVTLHTVALRPHRASALLSFREMGEACELTPQLRAWGCSAVELFDYASVQALLDKRGLPPFLREVTPEGAALLVQFQENSPDALKEALEKARALERSTLIHQRTEFFADAAQQNALWDLRKGLFPAVGARRRKGTSVIIEDVAFPLAQLAQGTLDLRRLLNRYEYQDAVIYGHARDGNLHFVFAQDFAQKAEVLRYEKFIDELTELVAVKHGGALKAEHGTGRNMAPFVEKEWGAEAYAVMKEIKRLLDPENLLNLGVILNAQPRAHLENLKTTPIVSERLDPCIECGFCEPVCPSQGLTLSPRGRIVLERERATAEKVPFSDFESVRYDVLDTCAADGLCARACPVGINTGTWVKEKRAALHSEAEKQAARWLSREMPFVESAAAMTLQGAGAASRVLGSRTLQRISAWGNQVLGTPVWKPELAGVPMRSQEDRKKIQEIESRNPQQDKVQTPLRHEDSVLDFIIFRSCVTRNCGVSQSTTQQEKSPSGAPSEGQDSLLVCSERAGFKVKTIAQRGLCCGQPWSSKGHQGAAGEKLAELIDVLFASSHGGLVPIVFDNSPCALSAKEEFADLSEDVRIRFSKLKILDPVEYALLLADKLQLKPLAEPIRFFPVCSVRKAGLTSEFEKLARHLSVEPHFPHQETCCGMAGDRGLWFPELPAHAAGKMHWEKSSAVHGVCSSRTCEVALSESGVPFHSIFNALEHAST